MASGLTATSIYKQKPRLMLGPLFGKDLNYWGTNKNSSIRMGLFEGCCYEGRQSNLP